MAIYQICLCPTIMVVKIVGCFLTGCTAMRGWGKRCSQPAACKNKASGLFDVESSIA